MNLKGRIIVITGSSKGLGLALKKACTERGATVIGCNLSKTDEDAQLDVRDEAGVMSFIEAAVAKHGRIDVLINNAGWSPAKKPLNDVTSEEFDRCMETNVKGSFQMIRAALPHMTQENGGWIVNICSRAGSRAHPGLTVYSAAKYAQRAMIQGLARELQEAGSAIRCCSVSPGGINTDMRAELFGPEDSAKQQSPETVAAFIADILEEKTDVPQGGDVQIVRGDIERIIPMDDR